MYQLRPLCKILPDRCMGRKERIYCILWWIIGNHIYKGEQLLPLITDEETLFRVTDAAIGFFEEHANPGERFRLLLQRVGEDEFRKVIRNAFEEK